MVPIQELESRKLGLFDEKEKRISPAACAVLYLVRGWALSMARHRLEFKLVPIPPA